VRSLQASKTRSTRKPFAREAIFDRLESRLMLAVNAVILPLDASQTTITAGQAVHVRAFGTNGTTLGAGTPETAKYAWNFGDSGSAYNTLPGFNAAHVYDNPGTYYINLSVTDESGSSAPATPLQITVNAKPTTTIHVAPNGTGTGNSANSPTNLADAQSRLTSNMVLLFAGGDYQITSGFGIGAVHDVTLDAEPNTGTPIFDFQTSTAQSFSGIISLNSASANHVMIQNLKLSYDEGTANTTRKCYGVYVRGKDITVRNCQFSDLDRAFEVMASDVTSGTLLQGNTSNVVQNYFAFFERSGNSDPTHNVDILGSDAVLLGNTADDSIGNHNTRAFCSRMLLYGNNFRNVETTSGSSGVDTLRVNDGSYIYWANNRLQGGRAMIGGFNADGYTGQRTINYVVVENNRHIQDPVDVQNGPQARWIVDQFQGSDPNPGPIDVGHIMFRNNYIESFTQPCISLSNALHDVQVLNNTGRDNSSSGSFFSGGGSVTNLTRKNNLYYTPDTTPAGLTADDRSSTGSPDLSDTDSDGFPDAPRPTNLALESAVPLAGVFGDLLGNPRSAAAPWTAGALSDSPINLAAAAQSGAVNLTWIDLAEGETNYKVERKTGAGGTYGVVAIIGPNAQSYSDTTVVGGTTYFYRVYATDASNRTGASNEASATAVATSSTPGSPDLVSASDTGSSATDNITKLNNSSAGSALQFAVSGTVSGATVKVYSDGTQIGSAVAGGTTTTVTTNGATSLADGNHNITATQTVGGGSESSASPALAVTVDTTAPRVAQQGFAYETSQSWQYAFNEDVSISGSPFSVTNLTGTQPDGSFNQTFDPAQRLLSFTYSSPNVVLPNGRYSSTLASTSVTDTAGNGMGANYSFGFWYLIADANRDGTVDNTDYNIMAANFGMTGATFRDGDFNYDGTVNALDFNAVSTYFGTTVDTFTPADIGGPSPVGSTSTVTANQDYDVTGGGSDVWNRNDQLQFAYRPVSGDFDISVQVTGIDFTASNPLVGLMARATTYDNSPNVYMRTNGGSGSFRFANRSTVGGTTSATGSTPSSPTTWLRLQRVGDTFYGYVSTDGVNWGSPYGSATIAMGQTVLVGMAVSSKSTTSTATAHFRHLTISADEP